MILGIGVDLIDVRRIEGIIFRWQHRFLKRIFTEKEIHHCNNKKNPAQRFATRFAAKHAFAKALFPKGADGIHFQHIEIDQRDERPSVNLWGKVKERADAFGVKNIHLMVSHDGDYAVANVVLEG
ncbi:MAG: holo-[acyl-carrier-protein] synthase [Deltaproteobacteria bacterium RIFCSPLOWO2_02_FULL_44_10]|nr:MAG: holo-[acyl-carrier-protein] synthase [Deltaproteobacteria bacterium RIFCSPHIGHO2_02_FULL_44_16]OGQ46600.1 MAG: holo-[acyl-carrier-protein] synthase [Deltaproteobacteria bacterium RIFCSPLOWO2_02_FULL_44_10]